MNLDCVFCEIGKHNASAKVEFENDSVIAFPSIEPAASTHIIIIPKEHVATFEDLEEKHKDILIEMAKAAQKIIEKKKISKAYKLVFNGGKYQSIPHIHWHLLGGNLENKENVINKT